MKEVFYDLLNVLFVHNRVTDGLLMINMSLNKDNHL
jgi:hypothetical protein